MSFKVYSSLWEIIFQILFPGGYLTVKQGYWIALGVFGISSLSYLLQMKYIGNKKILYTILLNFAILAITMFIPALLGLYVGLLISNGLYSIKSHRDTYPLANRILIGVLNCLGILGMIGACGYYIIFWRYLYNEMLAGGFMVGILIYLIPPIQKFYLNIPQNLDASRMKKIGLATGISFIILSSTFSCFGFIRPYEPAPESYTPSGSMDITVVSYNIRLGTGIEDNKYDFWRYRKDDMALVMDNFNADFICVQEAYYFQLRYLIKNLENKSYNFFGSGRDDGCWQGEHTAILFDSERFEFITGGNFWLSDYPFWPSNTWPAKAHFNRIVSWARFREIGTNEQIFVCSVHYEGGEEWRQRANVMLNERVADYSGDIPTIVAGDFNLNTSMSYWNLLEDYGDKPLNSSYHLFHGWQHYYNATSKGFNPPTTIFKSYMIDFQFVSSEVTVTSCEILDDGYIGPDGNTHYASDHYPVMATYTI